MIGRAEIPNMGTGVVDDHNIHFIELAHSAGPARRWCGCHRSRIAGLRQSGSVGNDCMAAWAANSSSLIWKGAFR